MDRRNSGRSRHPKNDQQRKTKVTASAATKKTNKLSRRKKAKAKNTLHKAIFSVMNEIDNDPFLRNHLFSSKIAKNKIVVGGYIIVKTDEACFNVYKKNLKNLVYENVFIFDAAIAIVESLNAGYTDRVEKILEAEEAYANNYTEMQIFKNAYKNAMETDPGNAHAFEDRYIIVKNRAKIALKEIRKFRIGGK